MIDPDDDDAVWVSAVLVIVLVGYLLFVWTVAHNKLIP
jgi:hypothetical protein